MPPVLLLLAAGVVGVTDGAAAPPAHAGRLKMAARTWCANSLRLDWLPDPVPAPVAATIASRDAMLKRRSLTAVPDALSDVGICTPGPATDLAARPLRSGNLEATATADGVAFKLADSGKTLFTATVTFAEQTDAGRPRMGRCTPGAAPGHDLGSVVNMTVDGAVEHCGKTRGCAGFSVEQGACYGGGVRPIHFKSRIGATDNRSPTSLHHLPITYCHIL